MIKVFLLFLVAIATHLTVFAQGTDQQLADHYYSESEYDKALIYYDKLYRSTPSRFYFKRVVECLEKTNDIKEAEKLLKREISSEKGDQELQIMLASLYERHEEKEKAEKIYGELIDDLRANSRDVIALYNAFKSSGKNERAFQTLEQGRKLLKQSYPLNFQFAEYYGSVGQTEKMIDEYLNMLDYHPSYLSSIQRVLANQIDFANVESKEFELLKEALLIRTQKNPGELIYAEMLTWLFIQRQNFGAALTHMIAIDKRSESDGRLVYELGEMCIENKDFTTARKCFQYVVNLGESSSYFFKSEYGLLHVSFLELTTHRSYSRDEINMTVNAYRERLQKFGKNRNTLSLILELAHIQAYYSDQLEEAVAALNEALLLNDITDMQRAEVKMMLADIHVLHGDIWEASLLYMQIDTDFKFEPIGHEAKFKNARIFYYDGEFDFAQSQLDVLKQSTTKLIANDAMNLSLLITENYGLDSNYIAMNWFANADLLIEQHQYEKAFVLFDSIMNTYPYHSLGDEILFKKSRAMELQGNWMEAINYLEELLKYYDDDILADDALFKLGDLYQNHLLDKEKAAEYYKRILFEFKGSLYTEEVRKRFQSIRPSSGS